MSGAGGNAHDTTQAFLNERKRGVVDIEPGALHLVIAPLPHPNLG